MERLLAEAQEDGGVLTDGIEERGPLEFAGDLAQNVDTLGLQGPKVCQPHNIS
jgi:hypothetical protein